MERIFKSILSICVIFSILISCAACANNGDSTGGTPKPAENVSIIHEPEFGGVYICLTIDEFNALGYQYGDSVRVTFSNGYAMDDLPYYNGYYVEAGQPLLVAYPGYDYIKAAVNYGEDLWVTADLNENDTASISLSERGKYIDMQTARDIHYSDARSDYDSDIEFANFRSVNVGDLKEDILFRSASPCDNQHERASYVDALIGEAGVGCILNLSDTDAKIEGYIAAEDFASPYFLSLYKEGNVIPVAMNMNYSSDEFKEKLAYGFAAMAQKEGPYLVHCTEGKDRTGFVCMLLEAFAGASYQEIVDDYMLTYDNYYGITKTSDPDKYDLIKRMNIDGMLQTVAGEGVSVQEADLAACAEAYLKTCGMNETDIAALGTALLKTN